MKMHLTKEMETLLIPLYGKAMMSRLGYFNNPYAEDAIKLIDYDFDKLKIQAKTEVMLSLRGALIDEYVIEFIDKNPDALILHLGCGLDARYLRIDKQENKWFDLDYPKVIDIKKQLYDESKTYKYISSSVTNLDWLEQMDSTDQEVIVIAEGLFMYLSELEIKLLFTKLTEKFSNHTLIFDAYSKMTAKNVRRQTSLKKTGAVIKWGVDSPDEIETYTSGLKYVKTLYLTDENSIKKIPKKYQRTFKFAGMFKLAREAHRIFIFKSK